MCPLDSGSKVPGLRLCTSEALLCVSRGDALLGRGVWAKEIHQPGAHTPPGRPLGAQDAGNPCPLAEFAGASRLDLCHCHQRTLPAIPRLMEWPRVGYSQGMWTELGTCRFRCPYKFMGKQSQQLGREGARPKATAAWCALQRPENCI